jgi:hypothetical protein
MRNLFRCTPILFVLLLTTAFGQTPTDAADSTKATVYIYRAKNGFGGPYKPSIFDNKREILRMRNGYFYAMTINPGAHIITSTMPGNGVSLEVKAGQIYYVSVEMAVPSAFSSYKGKVTLAAPEQGKFEVSQLKAVDPGDLK